ncbi:type II toxin-antitoxin system RelE/ParE family toxin [Pseudoxanthomonas dokdonensis]|uniref:Plasmid stabilization protein n=1 Tax=Pseudoxanthomonas dokdonensis TaxID=344882 RepID=A0A0R0CXK7_9GAMM|nr:type II toxin-antitoxin system RelE/ParE family toxin [Pseudoxanthomonas dokdonensis]KRG69832.1 plasmid stabilization protein [Pseudoxanthomonas dokdonensis]
MTFQVRFTEEAAVDLERLYGFLLEHGDGDAVQGERALNAIRQALTLLEVTPFSCRKAGTHPLLRELVIGFGSSGYVALFEIEDAQTVTVLAIRHQREDDYH